MDDLASDEEFCSCRLYCFGIKTRLSRRLYNRHQKRQRIYELHTLEEHYEENEGHPMFNSSGVQEQPIGPQPKERDAAISEPAKEALEGPGITEGTTESPAPEDPIPMTSTSSSIDAPLDLYVDFASILDLHCDGDPASELYPEYPEDEEDVEMADLDPETTQAVDVGSSIDLDPGSELEDDSFTQTTLPRATLPELRIMQEFNDYIKDATIDDPDSRLPPEVQHAIRNPPERQSDLKNSPGVAFSVELFYILRNAPRQTYEDTRALFQRANPAIEMLSYYQVKARLREETGIVPIVHDMCSNSCIAYVGPYFQLQECPFCAEPRYMANSHSGNSSKPRQTYYTIPLAPQLQAIWRSPAGARAARYRADTTKKIVEHLKQTGGQPTTYSDIFWSEEYINSLGPELINDGSMLLMMSLDGAQLYQHKKSDAWFYIWVLLDYAPDHRYKLKNILIGGIIPGPNEPKFIESFIAPGIHHLSACQKAPLRIYDGNLNITFDSRLIAAFGTADAPGIVHVNGLVGHIGAYSCRVYCPLKNRRKGSRYYCAMQKPHNYDVRGSDHDDIDIGRGFLKPSKEAYYKNLAYVLQSKNPKDYEQRRRATGIARPSIFETVPYRYSIPGMFPGDLMHAYSLNIPELLISLWRGQVKCDKDDDINTWDWAVLRDDEKWEAFGYAVQACSSHIPASFGRAARNPYEKISSGYKAVEYQQLLWGLSPALLYGLLPERYYEHHCKIVAFMRLVHLREISVQEVIKMHRLAVEYLQDFETLYVQRKPYRIHMMRPCLHIPIHAAPETVRIGVGSSHGQWTIERVIGSLGAEVRQPSNPFANLSERALLRAQLNAFQVLLPDLAFKGGPDDVGKLPQSAIDVGSGYILLPPRDTDRDGLHEMDTYATHALGNFFWATFQIRIPASPINTYRWARLKLPNGQVCRSYWGEEIRPQTRKLRRTRNIKFELLDGCDHHAEVLYFFQLTIQGSTDTKCPDGDYTLALISVYEEPISTLLQVSSGTLAVFRHRGYKDLQVVDVHRIKSVVAMPPMPSYSGYEGYFFSMARFGIDMIAYSGDEDEEEEG